MKNIILIILLFAGFVLNGQTITGDKVITRTQLELAGYKVTGISNDTLMGDNSIMKLVTQYAVKNYVANYVTANSLPSQGGNSGKYLTTNGTVASWNTLPDASSTNEIQTIDTLTVASNLLRIKLSGSAVKTLATSNFATSPAGSSMQVQYNNAGSFGALDSFTVSANPDRVGIGVPTPTARLDIQGSATATNALRIGSSTGADLMLFGNNGKVSLTNGAVTSNSTNDGILGITGFTHTANSGTTNALWGLNIDGTQVFNTANQTSGGLRIKLSTNATTSQYSTPLYIETNATTGAINYIKNTTATGGTQIRMTSGAAGTDMTVIQSPNSSTSGLSEGSGITIRTSSNHAAMGVRSSALALMNSSTSGDPQTVNPTFFILDKRIGVGQYAVNTPNATLDIKGEGATSATNALYVRNSSNTKLLTIRDDGLLNYSVTKTPSSASDTGTVGDIAWDSNYIYVCVGTNQWKRTAITTW